MIRIPLWLLPLWSNRKTSRPAVQFVFHIQFFRPKMSVSLFTSLSLIFLFHSLSKSNHCLPFSNCILLPPWTLLLLFIISPHLMGIPSPNLVSLSCMETCSICWQQPQMQSHETVIVLTNQLEILIKLLLGLYNVGRYPRNINADGFSFFSRCLNTSCGHVTNTHKDNNTRGWIEYQCLGTITKYWRNSKKKKGLVIKLFEEASRALLDLYLLASPSSAHLHFPSLQPPCMPQLTHTKLLSISRMFHASILCLRFAHALFFTDQCFLHLLCIQLTPIQLSGISVGKIFPRKPSLVSGLEILLIYCLSTISHCNYLFTCHTCSGGFPTGSPLCLQFSAAFPAHGTLPFTKCGLNVIYWIDDSR